MFRARYKDNGLSVNPLETLTPVCIGLVGGGLVLGGEQVSAHQKTTDVLPTLKRQSSAIKGSK